jgi:DNA-binding LacI/PurR family transcriptional regulator
MSRILHEPEEPAEKEVGPEPEELGRRPTLKDVAERAGVTPAMVSFTLSGKRRASEQTRQAVTKAAQELGYVPNPHAQRLANGGCDNTIALVWAIDLGISTQQAYFIQHRLDEAGFTVETHDTPFYVSDVETKQSQMLSALCRQRPRAIICRSRELQEPALVQLRRYAQESGTVVCYGSTDNKFFDQVIFDAQDNIYLAASHLLDLGHRNIGLSVHAHPLLPDDPALAGLQRALRERGVEARPEWLWANCCYEEAGARLAEQWLQLKERPSAMCIINDVTASTFITQLHRAGVRVPEDVSVVGYDDTPAARYALVSLTTVSHPVEGIARPIIEMLLSRLTGSYGGAPRCVEVKGELIVRESTAAPNL